MKDYTKFIAEWVVPIKNNPIKVRAEVFAFNKEHAASKLLCDSVHQVGLMLAFGKEIEDGNLSQCLRWLPLPNQSPDSGGKKSLQVS
jgi:hypothetical protein